MLVCAGVCVCVRHFHTRKLVSRLVMVNTEFILLDDDLVFPIRLSIVNDDFDFNGWWTIGRCIGKDDDEVFGWIKEIGTELGPGGGGTIKDRGGGNNGKQRFDAATAAAAAADVVEVDEGELVRNGKGRGGNEGVFTIDPWWKHVEWWGWWWWWWFRRLKRLRRRKNEPLSNMFSLAGSNVQ